jgi:hypothetical protein
MLANDVCRVRDSICPWRCVRLVSSQAPVPFNHRKQNQPAGHKIVVLLSLPHRKPAIHEPILNQTMQSKQLPTLETVLDSYPNNETFRHPVVRSFVRSFADGTDRHRGLIRHYSLLRPVIITDFEDLSACNGNAH